MAHLDLDITDGVATLTMNRPEARNALSMEMRAQLIEVLHDIEHDNTVRCVVLKGAGDHFMAGGDVKGMSESIKKDPSDVRKEFLLRIHDLHPIMFAMRRMPKPIIASCRGAAAGAGVSMALACDLVIAADDAFFTLAYCKIGTSPDGSSSFHLPRVIRRHYSIALSKANSNRSFRQRQSILPTARRVPTSERELVPSSRSGVLILLAIESKRRKHLPALPSYCAGRSIDCKVSTFCCNL